MLYIDPKDQPAHVSWPSLYALAWEHRKELRLKQAECAAEIAKLDTFIELYEKFDGKPKGEAGPYQFTVTSSSEGKSEGQK